MVAGKRAGRWRGVAMFHGSDSQTAIRLWMRR